jgi:hypothetical protein
MLYVQFYQPSALDPDTLIEASGDRSVVILDGRCSPAKNGRIAKAECIKRGYSAWCIFKGETFTRSRPVSMRYTVNTQPVRDPVWLSAHN